MTAAPQAHPSRISEEGDALRALYADWATVMAETPELSIRLLRSLFDEWHQVTAEPTGVTYDEETIGGVPGIWAIPDGADRAKPLVFLHGGGFAVGSASSHRKMAAHFAKALGVTAFVLDYRRAPEHPHPAQVEDGVAVVTALTERGIPAAGITTIGDSAGGNLAIAVPLALRDRGLPQPGRVIALSPWVDMENAGESLTTNAATDPMITPELLQGMIDGVLGGTVDPTTPLANPLYADFTGFPRLYVNAGAAEALLSDAERVAGRAKAAGVDVTYSVADGMQHVFCFMAGRAPEADDEIARIAAWYRG